MSKKMIPPDEISQALALREAGYTTLAISQRLGISVRTLQRHFAVTGTKKGHIKDELLNQAKEDLLAHLTSDQAIKEAAARLIADDLAHSCHLRELMFAASEQMEATNLRDAVLVMRAAAAYSTALKNTSDVIRHSLRVEKLTDEAVSGLPELVVRELTDPEIEALRKKNEAGDEANADDEVMTESVA